MEAKDFVTAIGVVLTATLAIIGWFVNKHKDKEQEKFKLRHARREEMVKAFLKFDEALLRTRGNVDEDSKFSEYWLSLAGLMRLYGTKAEHDALLTFSEHFFGSNRSLDQANLARNALKEELTASVRGDLGFDPL